MNAFFCRIISLAIILTLTCLPCSEAYATYQKKDLLIVNGRVYYAHMPFLELLPDLKLPIFYWTSTANRDGYRSTWAVMADRLYLVGIEGNTSKDYSEWMQGNKQLFPKVVFPLEVTSFNGSIKIEGMELQNEGKREYGPEGKINLIYAEEIILRFNQGRLVDESRTIRKKNFKK